MKIKKLTIKNFLAISEASVELDDRGLVLIQGENNDDSSADSNGVGKSSIVDALSWAIFGVTARGVSGDSVVNRIEGKNCQVIVNLEDGDNTYVIDRNRKHYQNKNKTIVWSISGNVMGEISKGTEKETQKLIESIIGCSKEVFLSAIYCGQENMVDLPTLTDKNLKLIVEEAAGIQRIEKAYEVARKEAEEISAQYSDAVMKRDLYWDDYNHRVEVLKGIKKNFDDWDELQKDKIVSVERQLKDAQKALESSQSHLNSLDKETIMREKETLVANARASKVDKEKVSDELDKTIQRIIRLKSNRQYCEKKLKDIVATIKKLRDNPESFTCEVCGSPLNADHIAKCEKEGIEEAKRQKNELLAFDADIEKVEQKKIELGNLLNAPEDTDTSKVDELLKKISEINDAESDVQKKESNLQLAKTRVENAKAEVNPYKASYERAVSERDDAITNHKECEDKADKLSKEYELRKAVVNVFSPAGVRALILDTVTPFLNQRTSAYLSVLSDGNISAVWNTLSRTKSGELREKFKIEVVNEKGGETFESLSGGEKRKVRLATALALQDLVSARATKSISLWIGDEIDNALDASGLERLMTILNTKAQEKGTVLIISHTNLRDWCSNVMTVRKENGKSTIGV